MEPPHPSTEAQVRLYRDELGLDAVEAEEIEHLNAVCPECARTWQKFVELRRQQEAAAEPAAAAEQERLQTREMQARLDGDRRLAEQEVERLLAIEDAEERSETARRAYKHYRTPAFIERMIEQARTWLRLDHREALKLLAIAEDRLPRIRREIYGERLVHLATLRVLAHQANTLRFAGELPAAEAKFAEIRERLGREPVEEPALLGELASLEASLRYDQRRLEEADALLDRGAECFREVGDGVGLAKVLIKRGMVRYIEGDAQGAIPSYEAAVAATDPEDDPELAIAPRHNLVLCLCATGQGQEARLLLDVHRPLYRQLPFPVAPLWLLWAEGKVAGSLGESDAAIERLRAARDGYTERGLEFDASLVDLDLAEVHLSRGETAEVKRLAERMAHTFAGRGVDREAARAVALFRKAAVTEAVTLDLIARTRRVLLRFSDRPLRRTR